MPELVDATVVSVAIGLAILCGLCAIAFYVVSNFRDYSANDGLSTDEVLANLREMHSKGEITEEEFRDIEATNHLKRETANKQRELPTPNAEEAND